MIYRADIVEIKLIFFLFLVVEYKFAKCIHSENNVIDIKIRFKDSL